MSKKKRRKVISKKKLKEKRLAAYPQPVFSVGDLVQVNDGVMDANWEELPIGGWVGSVTKIDREPDGPEYEVIWTHETMEKAHPVFEQLASLEGLKNNEYHGLKESELHLFSGGPVVLVEPADVSMYTDRPLDPEDTADRIRMIFGTKPLDWFPTLGDDEGENIQLLQRYYEYLSEQLTFPFEAVYINRESARVVKCPFTVEGLVDPEVVQKAKWNGPEGIYCSGTEPNGNVIEVPLQNTAYGNIPQKQLLEDYRSWIGGFSLELFSAGFELLDFLKGVQK